jgi:hypothetical protein
MPTALIPAPVLTQPHPFEFLQAHGGYGADSSTEARTWNGTSIDLGQRADPPVERARIREWQSIRGTPPGSAKRRPVRISVAEVSDGGQFTDAKIIEALRRRGLDPTQVVVRSFDAERASVAIHKATDRDQGSRLDWSDQQVADAYGVNVAHTTYVLSLREGAVTAPTTFALLLYDSRRLFELNPATGLHAFVGQPRDALIAVIAPHGAPTDP